MSGSTLSIDPSQLNELALGDEVVITVSYAVSDGTTSIANTATVSLAGVNDAPVVTPISDTKSEEDAAFTVDLLAGSSDPDGDTLSLVGTPTVTAVDGDGNSVSVPPGGVSFSDNIMSVDPNAFNPLNTGQSLTFQAAYRVTDGTASTANTATITINGFTDPFVTISDPGDFSLAENNPGDVTAITIGQVSASGHATVSYDFANGTQADGDYRIDSSTGAITYVGTGKNYEAGSTPSNIATSASLSTTVTSFLNFTVEQALANMVDGDVSTSGISDYSVHPENADGDTITFDFDANYNDPTFVFYSRTNLTDLPNIDGSTLEYKRQGQTVHTETLDSSTHSNFVITVDSPDNFDFDQVVLTFSGDDQNFREVEILAKQSPVDTLEVRATSGSVTDVTFVDVAITDVSEPLVLSNALADQTGKMATSSSFTIPADSFIDPDGTDITYNATLIDGSALPSWISFDAATRTFAISDQGPSGRLGIRVTASSGGDTVRDDFNLFMTENFAAQAAVSSQVTDWNSGTTDENLAAITDGITSTTGDLDYAVHPQNADKLTLTFDMLGSFQAGSFVFYNRTGGTVANRERINDSTVTFRANGSDVFSGVLSHANEVNGTITLAPATNIVFDEVILTFDGDSQNFREIEIYGLPMIEFTSAESFTINENTGNANVFTLAATADAAVTYSFIDGSQVSGDYSINASTGVITYNGSGFDYENSQMVNRAPMASITTTISNFLNFSVSDALDNMVDGNTSSSGADNYSVSPTGADGKNIVFDFGEALTQGGLRFYNRVGSNQDLIDGSTVEFRRNGSQVHSETLVSANAVNDIISIDAPLNVVFDSVVLTFSGDAQNFREVEIFGVPDGTGSLFVRATSGSYSRDMMVDVIVGDVNEAPQPNGVIGDQTVQEGEKGELTLADDLFIDPEGDNLSFTATMVDGTDLPDFILFDGDQGQFQFEPGPADADKYDIRVFASDGQLSSYVEFTLTVEDVL